MKTILFPTDFSANALHAFHYAKIIAKAQKAKIIFFYTYNIPLIAPVNDFTTREQTQDLIDENLRKAALQNMEVYTNQLDAIEIDYNLIIKEGYPAKKIAKYCKKEQVDLLIMGTQGQTNNRDYFMGSLTAKVIEKVHVPLLAIPESAEIHNFKKIVFATDLIYNSSEELRKALSFAKSNNSSLTFLHIETNPEEVKSELDELTKTIKNNKNQDLKLEVILADTFANGINSYLQNNKTDLLITSNHTKSFFEKLFHKSVSKQMVLHSKIPLLIFSKEIHPVVFF